MRFRGLSILQCLLVATTLLAQEAVPPEVQLKTAIDRELMDGDMSAAIARYRAIAEGSASNHAVAAQALLQMAACYEKLGRPEALEAYARIVRDYPDSGPPAVVARAKVQALMLGAQSGVVARQITSDASDRLYGQAVSRDGRFVAYVDAGHIYAQDLSMAGAPGAKRNVLLSASAAEGGERRIVTRQSADESLTSPLMSPDGTKVAYIRGTSSDRFVMVVNTDGTGARVLSRMVAASLTIDDWSPDGSRVLLSRASSRPQAATPVASRLWTIEVDDGSEKTVSADSGTARFSPDGRWIACACSHPVPDEAGSPKRGIWVFPASGAPANLVLDDPNAALDGWSPDGRAVVIERPGATTDGLWSIAVKNGRPLGTPEFVKPTSGRFLGRSAAGEYFFQTSHLTHALYQIEIDQASAAAASQPRELMNFVNTHTGMFSWSPDDSSIAYYWRNNQGDSTVVVHPLTGGRDLTVEPQPVVNDEPHGAPMWLPSGESLLLQLGHRLFQLDLKTHSLRRVLGSLTVAIPGPIGQTWSVRLSPDGRSIYYWEPDQAGKQVRILSRDLAGGEPKQLCSLQADRVVAFDVSRDGARLGLVTQTGLGNAADTSSRAIVVVDIGTGRAKEILRPSDWPRDIVWTRDGEHLIYVSRSVDGQQPSDLRFVSAAGGPIGRYAVDLHGLYSPALDSKGTRLLFSDEDHATELWAFGNLIRVR